WSTVGHVDGLGAYPDYAYVYFNYTKPVGASSTSLWQVKDSGSYPSKINMSIPSDCWNQDPLRFQYISIYVQSTPAHIKEYRGSCWDGDTWQSLRSGSEGDNIYEEAMWWNISVENPDTAINTTEGGEPFYVIPAPAPWNVTSAVYLREFYVGGKETNPQGFFFKPDGLKMYT
ncbi:unnamed protein product, partial [marine sediment metagenome]